MLPPHNHQLNLQAVRRSVPVQGYTLILKHLFPQLAAVIKPEEETA